MPTYEEIAKAVKFFDEVGVPEDDLAKAVKQMRQHAFNEGFDQAVHIIENVLHGLNFTLVYPPAEIIELIENEIEAYKKDG